MPGCHFEAKGRVYDSIVEYLAVEGCPTKGNPDAKEASITHLVYATINPVLGNSIRITGRKNIQSRSEKDVSTDGETGGTEESVATDPTSVEGEEFVHIVGAKSYLWDRR